MCQAPKIGDLDIWIGPPNRPTRNDVSTAVRASRTGTRRETSTLLCKVKLAIHHIEGFHGSGLHNSSTLWCRQVKRVRQACLKDHSCPDDICSTMYEKIAIGLGQAISLLQELWRVLVDRYPRSSQNVTPSCIFVRSVGEFIVEKYFDPGIHNTHSRLRHTLIYSSYKAPG